MCVVVPEGGLMEELKRLGGGGELSQVQLEAGHRLLQLPWLEHLIAHDVRNVVDGHVRLVSRRLTQKCFTSLSTLNFTTVQDSFSELLANLNEKENCSRINNCIAMAYPRSEANSHGSTGTALADFMSELTKNKN